jgi:hypothetical protein
MGEEGDIALGLPGIVFSGTLAWACFENTDEKVESFG